MQVGEGSSKLITDTRSRIIHHHKKIPFFSFSFLFFSKNVQLTRGYTHRIFSFIFLSSQMSLLVNFISNILLSMSCSAWPRANISYLYGTHFPLQTINISQFGLTARKWQNCKSRFSTRHAPGMS